MSKSTNEIRQTFLDFFYNKGHQIIASSSLVPDNDPTLLFTNAGMNRFKGVFLGQEKCNYSRVATSQRCVRAGGKHNDLENVGYTTCHHTFFEMLGNFSFGDYFKKEAISFAWELLTSSSWFNLSKERLWVTVYATDDESWSIWANDIGMPNERIIRIGDNKGEAYASDNFWQMSDIGPCGPCSEIFYDHGKHLYGGPPGSLEGNGDRYVEIWNIVFMQFNRQSDGTMQPLPKPSVDTGMGLERISAILQNVNSNYEIDIFQKIIKDVAKITGTSDLNNKSLFVIADHIRSCSFLISDGVIPSNQSRGYVLRRIIRRAVHHGNILGIKGSFFYKLIDSLIDAMGSISNNLQNHQMQIAQIIKNEEEQFAKTLERGLSILDEELNNLCGDILDGEIVFRLYDTFGFPVDLTADICRERNINIDKSGFEIAMKQQRQRARKESHFSGHYNSVISINSTSAFKGYNNLSLKVMITDIYVDGQHVNEFTVGQEGIIVLDETPFYGESGGQVGDTGVLKGINTEFNVIDTKKYGQVIGHIGRLVAGHIRIGDYLNAQVDKARRARICLNHSAIHLLHAALRQVLGYSVVQKGSLVNDKYLRLDFSYGRVMKDQEIRQVDAIVNTQIRRNLLIETNIMDLEKVKAGGTTIALFDHKYNTRVRVLSMGDFSTELCGGTHATRTGDIGLFRIISESGIASGIRRIEAITGEAALMLVNTHAEQLHNLTKLVKVNSSNLHKKVRSILEHVQSLKKELQQLKYHQLIKETALLSKKAIEINGAKLLVSELSNVEPKLMRTIIDDLKNQFDVAVIVLATVVEGKISLVAGVTKNISHRVKADELINFVAHQIGGKGGGRSDIAQAGGINTKALDAALTSVKSWVTLRL